MVAHQSRSNVDSVSAYVSRTPIDTSMSTGHKHTACGRDWHSATQLPQQVRTP